MKNKKIVVCLVIAVMVLGFVLTALVGCKDWKDVKVADMMDFLITAVENTAADNNLNNLQLAADISVETQYGDSNKTYNISLATDLGLNTANDKKNAGSLVITDGDGKNVISAFYNETTDTAAGAAAGVYLQLGENGRFWLPAVFVKQILADNNATVTDEQSQDISKDIVFGLDDLTSTLQLIGSDDEDSMGILKTQVSKDGLTYRLSVSLADVFAGDTWASILEFAEGLQEMITKYGIALDIKTLGDILPMLEATIDIKVSSKKVEEATITGISASLDCPATNLVIGKVGSTDKLLTLKLDNNLTAKVSIDLALGENKVKTASGFTNENTNALGGAINFTASGTLELKNAIQTDIAGILNIDIPTGTYKLNLGVEIDPAAIANMANDFKNIHSTQHAIEVALKAIDAGVKYINIEITKANGDNFLRLEFATKNGHLTATENINIEALNITNNIILNGIKTLSTDNVMSLIGSIEGIANTTIIKDQLDTGYAYKDPNLGWKGGYTAAEGFVDKDDDGNPDKDKNGYYVCADGYVLVLNLPYKQEVSEAEYNEKVNAIADEKEKAAFVASFNNLYNKDEDRNVYVAKGYTWDGEKYVVDTANGFVNDNGNPKKDNNGNYSCASGYQLYKGFPMTKEEAADREKEDAENQEESTLVNDLIKGLAIVIDKSISVTLGNLKINDKISLAATLGINTTGINVNATVNGLNQAVSGVTLPETLGVEIIINFSDFHYGTANR